MRHVVKLGVSVKPLERTDLTLTADFVRTRIDDPIAAFPIAAPEIEVAFPDRFTRDGAGRLLRIDSRPLNFDRSDQSQVRWGINFTRPLAAVPPGMRSVNARFVGSEADLSKALPPGAQIIKPPPGSPAARRFENLASRLDLSLYYTYRFTDEIRVRPGGPVLDLLDGSATGPRGGSPRHQIEFQATAFKHGLGARVAAKWQSGSIVRGLAAIDTGTVGDLDFLGLTSVNVDLFANLADRIGRYRVPAWLKGTRIGLGIANLFDSRPEVLDQARLTPISYQPAYLDPLGRLVNLSVRKLF